MYISLFSTEDEKKKVMVMVLFLSMFFVPRSVVL